MKSVHSRVGEMRLENFIYNIIARISELNVHTAAIQIKLNNNYQDQQLNTIINRSFLIEICMLKTFTKWYWFYRFICDQYKYST